MTLEEKFENISKTSTVKSLKEYNGASSIETAKDFDELWDKVIKDSLPDEKIVLQWHNLLMRYIKQENAAFSLRAYGSGDARRGLLNRVFVRGNASFETFYTDNSVPFYFYSMAKDGFVPEFEEFNDAMTKSRTFRYGYFPSSNGKEFVAYLKGKNPGINDKGFKLAHVFSAGENYNECAGYAEISKFCGDEFKRGNISDWSHLTLPNGKYYRRIDICDAEKAAIVRAFAVAHFLRSVHPLNYFLVPLATGIKDKEHNIKKTNIYWYDYDKNEVGKDIGEYSKLIEYVTAKIKKRYEKVIGSSGKSIYYEFCDLIFPMSRCIDPKGENMRIDAEYALEIWKKNIASAATVASSGGNSIKTSNHIQNKTRDYSGYNFVENPQGNPYRKGRLVLAVVAQYAKEGKATNYSDLRKAFPDELQGSKGVVRLLKAIPDKDKGIGGKKRYYVNDGEIITLKNGDKIVVSDQWGGADVMDRFIDYVTKKFNYTITKI